jgi:hypothetical protein
MHFNTDIPSLAHYLENPNACFQLKLLPRQEKDSIHERDYFPFSTIRDADPLASIIEASIVSDAGSGIKNVFILIQKDDYQITPGETWPANNRDIDQAWQNLFTYLENSDQKNSLVILKDQLDNNGRLLQWSPLFYCRYRQIFFQPPCPFCGLPLKMCDDDALLSQMNLKPYGTSLTRYLFCPRCNNTEDISHFYVRTQDVSDPEALQDQHDLIRGFGRLVQDGREHSNIPCHSCTSFHECYHGDHLSDSRIIAVSFYPFFTIVIDAPSMHILDFLSLVAGADPDDVVNRLQTENQGNRLKYIQNFATPDSQNSLLFFNKDQKHFLEVLYLKLCLLGQLSQLVFQGLDKFSYPDLALSLDRIWVKLADQGGMMPPLWNFILQYIGVDGDSHQPTLSLKPDQSYALSFLGTSWFSVLFMNSRQDFSLINSEIEKITNSAASKTGLNHESRFKINQSHIFSPENIFWNPHQHMGCKDTADFLIRSLDLGFFLIKSSFEASHQWSQTDFWKQYEHLTAEIKSALFMSEMKSPSVPVSDATKDIFDILVRIARKWRSSMETVPPETEQASIGLPIKKQETDKTNSVSPLDVLIKKTVVLTPDIFREEPTSHDIPEKLQPETRPTSREPVLSPGTVDHGSESAEALPETRIISQNDRPLPSTEHGDEDIPKTVVVSQKDSPALQENSHEKSVEGSAGDETSPRKKISEEDNVPETVIINYKKSQGGQ